MDRLAKYLSLCLVVLLAVTSTTVLTAKTANAQHTPFQLITPSTIAPPKNYSVPPLSSLNLKVSLSHDLGPMGGCGGLIYIKGGSGNDINFRVIDPQGKTILDLGRISNEKEFYISPDETGDFTIIVDNEFSVFSSKEVTIFSATYPDNIFEFAGFSINIWAIILVVISVAALLTFVVWLIRHRKLKFNTYTPKIS
jgi:hypothetical protein